MANSKDTNQRKLYDTRQLGLKIIANSVYGVLTASGGWFVRMAMGESVTAWGRSMINQAKCIAQAPPFSAEVIYGDTDSIMMVFPETDTVPGAMEKLKEVCAAVTKTFPKPVELQAEKVYCPHIQFGKKKYAGYCYVNGESPKIDSKGIEKNRLDNCPLVRKMMTEILNVLLVKNDLQAALEYIHRTLVDLIQGRIDYSDLVITKSVSKPADDYKGMVVHIEVAKRMAARDHSYTFAPGERIPFVIVHAPGAGGPRGPSGKPKVRTFLKTKEKLKPLTR